MNSSVKVMAQSTAASNTREHQKAWGSRLKRMSTWLLPTAGPTDAVEPAEAAADPPRPTVHRTVPTVRPRPGPGSGQICFRRSGPAATFDASTNPRWTCATSYSSSYLYPSPCGCRPRPSRPLKFCAARCSTPVPRPPSLGPPWSSSARSRPWAAAPMPKVVSACPTCR